MFKVSGYRKQFETEKEIKIDLIYNRWRYISSSKLWIILN